MERQKYFAFVYMNPRDWRVAAVEELTCTKTCVTPDLLSLSVRLQPEEYGQEAMEGQGEGILDPEGETYDETQQVSSTQHTACLRDPE